MFVKVGRKAMKTYDDDKLSHFAMGMTLLSNGTWFFLALILLNDLLFEFSLSTIQLVFITGMILNWLVYFVLYDFNNRWKDAEIQIEKRLKPYQRNRIFFTTLMFYYLSIVVLYAFFF